MLIKLLALGAVGYGGYKLYQKNEADKRSLAYAGGSGTAVKPAPVPPIAPAIGKVPVRDEPMEMSDDPFGEQAPALDSTVND